MSLWSTVSQFSRGYIYAHSWHTRAQFAHGIFHVNVADEAWRERNGLLPSQAHPIIAFLLSTSSPIVAGWAALHGKASHQIYDLSTDMHSPELKSTLPSHNSLGRDGFTKNAAGVCLQEPLNLFWVLVASTTKFLPAQPHSHHMMFNEAFVSAYVCLFIVQSMWVKCVYITYSKCVCAFVETIHDFSKCE